MTPQTVARPSLNIARTAVNEFATGNDDKLREFERILGIPVVGKRLKVFEPQVEPDSSAGIAMQEGRYQETAAEIAKIKAKLLYLANGHKPIIGEDTALFVVAMDGEPGVNVKSWDTPRKRQVIINAANDPKLGDNRALWVVTFSCWDGDKENPPSIWQSATWCRVAKEEKKTGLGFAFDEYITPLNDPRTFSQMTGPEKDQYSPRKVALASLVKDPLYIKP